jgi:hypothetical protein
LAAKDKPMKFQGLLLAGAAGALAILTGSASLSSTPADVVNVGGEVAYTFRNTPVNGAGLKSLASLRGKPVLIEFWGTR